MTLPIRSAAPIRPAALACVVLLLNGCVGTGASLTIPDTALGLQQDAGARIVVTVRNPAVRTAQHTGSTPKAYDATGRYQVSPVALRDVAALAAQYGLQQVSAWPIEVLGVHCVVFEVPASLPREQVIAELRRDRRVESVQPLQLFQTQTKADYNDAYAGLQSSLAALDVSSAHKWSRGRGVRVAVIDTGMDIHHPDLVGRVIEVRDFVGGEAPEELHATAIAGVIAATANNGQGIVGIAPEAGIMALRACWQAVPDDQNRRGAVCNTFTLAQAIAAAIADRADILNLSLTGPPDPLLERLLLRALSLGRIVISAWPEVIRGFVPFPASMPGVIAVATAETAGVLPEGGLRAPGEDILTLSPRGRYDFASGSSLSAAGVSGVAALILARKPGISVNDLRMLLQRSEEGSSNLPRVINACAALASLIRGVSCAEQFPHYPLH
jgi:Subtilase family